MLLDYFALLWRKAEAIKYASAIPAPRQKHEGEILMTQAMEEDEMLLSMLHVLVEEL